MKNVLLTLWSAFCCLLLTNSVASACPFCTAVSQTIRQEMQAMDAVVIATCLDTDATRDPASGEVRMRIESVLKGESLIQVGNEVTTVYYGAVDTGRKFMLSGVDPPQLLWSCLPLSEKAEAYVAMIPKLADDPLKRLTFFYDYLQSDDPMLQRDAYDEFATAPYDVVRQMKDRIDHDELVRWLSEPELPTDRKRLYLTLLGVVGQPSDVPMLEKMLRSTQKSTRGGLDALIACYLTLAGEQGLPVIEELFLANHSASYTDTYAAVMAIRFHGTEGDVIARTALTGALHHLLERPELADLVIPDLARWDDWSQIDRVKKLFIDSDPDNNWIRVPVVNYLRACPLPEADTALAELTEIDPESVRRANTYYAIPVPARDTSSDQSSLQRPDSKLYASLGKQAVRIDPATSRLIAAQPNRWRMTGVLAMSLASVVIAVGLVLTGGPVSKQP